MPHPSDVPMPERANTAPAGVSPSAPLACDSPFPLEVVVACRSGAQLQAAAVLCGRPAPAAARAFPLVLHGPDVGQSELVTWKGPQTLVAPAARVLDLVAPGRSSSEAGAAEVGAAYWEGVRCVPPRGDLLRLAWEVLPETARVERGLVARALATCAERSLRGNRGESGRKAGDAAGTLVTGGTASLYALGRTSPEPHALLDACFAALAQRWSGPVGFEPRDGQVEMAHTVLDAFLGGGTRIVEAGTGIGKSLAYALPAVLFAWLQNERVVVTTHTRNLQEQLVAHDLPRLWEALDLHTVPRHGGRPPGLRFAKLLGRSNYLCRSALERWTRAAADRGGGLEAARAVLAAMRCPDGVLDEMVAGMDASVLAELRSRRETCQGRACRADPPCPVYAAREAARAADLLVINHALLFADARSEGNIFGEYAALVVDEAHNLERVATESLAVRIGVAQAESVVASARRLEGELHALRPHPEVGPLELEMATLLAGLVEVRRSIGVLLERLDGMLTPAARARPRQRYRDPDEVFGAVREEIQALRAELGSAGRAGAALAAALAERVLLLPELVDALPLAELVLALRDDLHAGFEHVVRADPDDWVYYLELPEGRLREIAASPLAVADRVQQALAGAPARVFTSATLLVDGDAGYFRSGVGLPAETPVLQVASPFDYARQCTVVQTADLGDYRQSDFDTGLAELLAALHRRTARRMLVLLTSYTSLRALYAALRVHLGEAAPLLAQGQQHGRVELARRLAATPGAILLGTNSFWEGVDLPGEAMEILVFPKLPFAVPDEPIVEARCERLRALGEDPFLTFVLPEAVLRFRQGFGRLIRTRQDRGAVLVLDGRIETRAYGESFLGALPAPARRCSAAQVVEHVAEWFGSRPV